MKGNLPLEALVPYVSHVKNCQRNFRELNMSTSQEEKSTEAKEWGVSETGEGEEKDLIAFSGLCLLK
jgi:hypothetical protein